MKGMVKKTIFLMVMSYIEINIAATLSNFFIIFPITFLGYSFYVYRTNSNANPIEAFLFGLLVDLIHGSYFGLNATLFCLITYLINSYSNAFKIFSYLQVCLFFGLSATAYVGFTQLVLNIYNFSYITLLVSSFFNIIFCILVAVFTSYFPKTLRLKI